MPPAGRRGSKAIVLVELPVGRVVTPERAVVVAVLWLPLLEKVVVAEPSVLVGAEALSVAEALADAELEADAVAGACVESAPARLVERSLYASLSSCDSLLELSCRLNSTPSISLGAFVSCGASGHGHAVDREASVRAVARSCDGRIVARDGSVLCPVDWKSARSSRNCWFLSSDSCVRMGIRSLPMAILFPVRSGR